ncbi:amidohydrolase family protein [Peterkaempfera bronchialis]|uniref:Amidohydrolase n=1 Tax=Peterkaempfera bronchialis TaxID=2126346 RepID=A0A345T3P1_9ACTN|nr:amidohydrolase family protein [Peterkaempfera bronchialis]AXI80596.1 amidohydrolase [Peterkaempfera bronchialis]
MNGKIALEEHFNLPEFSNELPQYVNPEMMREVSRRLLEVSTERLGEMDATGIDYSLLSLTAPGVQAETDPRRAVTRARRVNDELATIVAAHPTRYGGFATLPMQDPAAAVAELERCVTQLGFHGVMLNGFTNIGDADTGWYYDHERFLPFWERVEALGVPVYLHPRDPLLGNQGIYEGHPELFGAVWSFTVETATHALRLMTSGLFDRFPRLTVILGHLGETLPFNMWRIDHRAAAMGDLIKFKKPLTHYLLDNFYVTTSGNFHTQTLNATLAEMGVDRVLFSSDYPYESMREAADWFDNAAINHNDRVKIGHTNARRLFPGLPERIGRSAHTARV